MFFFSQAICNRIELPSAPALLQAIDNIKAKMCEVDVFNNMDRKLKIFRERERTEDKMPSDLELRFSR